MSNSYNHATFTGNLGRDPEIRYTPQGTAICSFSIAVNNRKKIDGEWKDEAMWVKVNVWGKQAENASQFLAKGRPCLVDGRLDVENWTDKDGKARFNLVLNCNQVTFLGDKPQGGSAPQSSNRPPASTGPAAPPAEPEITDDDIPF